LGGAQVAPVTGYVLWRLTQPIIKRGTAVLAVAVPAAKPEQTKAAPRL
jgi:hypothetical protein